MEASPNGRSAVLWDLDGTLIDSGDYHFRAWRDTLATAGRDLSPEAFAASFGQFNDTIVRRWFGPELTASEVERISEEKETRYRTWLLREGVELLPGAEAWLRRLQQEGWRQALATSAPPANVEAVLKAVDIRPFLDAVVSAADVPRGKPDPAVFLLASARLGVPPSRCVVVEDAPAGLEGARRAGMRSVGVLSPHFKALIADLVVPSLAALPDAAFHDLLQDR
jgi:HAD superfamily hydrolase (TIGR01509 family)